MKKIRSISLLMLLIAAMFLPWNVVSPTVTVQAQTTDPIKIGFFGPFTTAGLAFYAPWSKQGFELGMIYATTEMGYDNENKTAAGRPYEISYYDTKGSVTDVAAQVTSAIETDGIDIIVGGTYSSVAGAMMPVAKEYKKLYFICPAADSSLTAANFNPYSFRLARNSWHDAYTAITYAMDTLEHEKFAFLAADYSFGYSGVDTMKAVIQEKGGSVTSIQYAPLGTTDFGPYLTNILAADANPILGVDYLIVIWAGSFSAMYSDFGTYDIASYMELAGACIDIYSMNVIEAGMVPPATYIGGRGLCLYGYDLPDNPVNDWMVDQHVARNIRPNAGLPGGHDYRVPELLTAGAFATAQFLVNVTNAVPDINVNGMINHLESGLLIDCPKGPTYLRPEDHQGLAEMYVAEAWNDTRSGSETEGFIIAKHVETLHRDVVAPPIASNYTPGEFAPVTTPAFDTLTVIFGFITVSIIAFSLTRRRRK